MLSLNQTFDETRTIKVLVVPIGNNSLFDDHFKVVSNLKDVPFYELNRPPSSSSSPSPFKYFNWNDGNLLFEFQRYDRVLIGPGDLNNFQSSKRILMIMGLINYPELGETANRVEEEMEYFARRHPNIILRRLFVFNYSFDDPQANSNVTPLMAHIRDPASLVIFPPDGQCGTTASDLSGDGNSPVVRNTVGEVDRGVSMVDVHLTEVMSHAALQIVLTLEQQMRVCEESRVRSVLPEGLPMCTIYDDMDEGSGYNTPRDHTLHSSGVSGTGSSNSASLAKSNSTSRKQAVGLYKKKPSGRIHKWMGDLSMQVCSPRDAIEHYTIAIAECRALNETLWLAGALDGLASAVVLLVQRNEAVEEVLAKELKGVTVIASDGSVSENAAEKAFRLAEDRTNDAISVYASSVVFCAMEVECLLRLAYMLEHCPFGTNREGKVLEYVMRAVTVPGLNSQQQLEVMLEGAIRCHRLGLWRKYAMFMYIAALMSAECENFGVAHALMRYAFNECGLTTSVDGKPPLQLTRIPQKGKVIGSPSFPQHAGACSDLDAKSLCSARIGGVWNSLLGTMYSSATLIADEHGDSLAASHYLVGLMQLIQDGEQRHAVERSHWQKLSLQHLVAADEKTAGTPSAASSSKTPRTALTRTGANTSTGTGGGGGESERSVRWDAAEQSRSGAGAGAGVSAGDAAPTDRSPVPRRSKTMDTATDTSLTGTISATVTAAAVAVEENMRTPPPIPTLHRSVSPMAPKRLASQDSGINQMIGAPHSYPPPSPSDPSRFYDAVDTSSSNTDLRFLGSGNSGLLQQSGGGRRLIIPVLSERLNSLSQITHPVPSKARQISADLSGSAVARVAGQGEMLVERFLRTISQQDSGLGSLTPTSSNAMQMSREESGAQAGDALEAMAELLAESKYPLELQEETYGLFARLSRSIVPNSKIPIPVSLQTLRPVELIGCARPIPVVSTPLTTARRNLLLFKQNQQNLQDGSRAVTADDATATTSSLFYDPFEARRRKQLVEAQKSNVLWAVDQKCRFIAVMNNPLSVPVFLTSVFPLLEGAAHSLHPISVHIPPNADAFEVELVIIPKAVGELKTVGLQFIMNNATHVLNVDATGRCVIAQNNNLFQGKGSSGRSLISPTNTVVIVPPSPRLTLRTSWEDGTSSESLLPAYMTAAPVLNQNNNKDLERGQSDPDVIRTLGLFLGEMRAESVWLSSVPSSSLSSLTPSAPTAAVADRLVAESAAAGLDEETHFKVTLHHTAHPPFSNNAGNSSNSNSNNSKPISTVLRPYTGPLSEGEDCSVSFCSISSATHNPQPRPPSFTFSGAEPSKSASNIVSADNAVLTVLPMMLHCENTNLQEFDLIIEVCSARAAVFRAIEALTQEPSSDSGADNKKLLLPVELSDLNMYARRYHLRVKVRHETGISLRSASLLRSSTAMPVPEFQLSAVRMALQDVLKVCAMQRKLMTGENAVASKIPVVKLLPKYMDVLMEVVNGSAWHGCIGLFKLGEADAAPPDLSAESKEPLIYESDLINQLYHQKQQPQSILRLPPYCARSVVLRYRSDAAMMSRSDDNISNTTGARFCDLLPLQWQCVDSSRFVHHHSEHSTDCVAPHTALRHGYLITAACKVDISRESSLLAPIFRSVPGLIVQCNVQGGGTALGRVSADITPQLKDARLGDLYDIAVGKFYDLNISLLNRAASAAVDIELALVVVSNEVPSVQHKGLDRIAPSPTSHVNNPYILTGKVYARYHLCAGCGGANHVRDQGNQEEAVHRVRICFPEVGSYCVHPLVRRTSACIVDSDNHDDGGSEEEWWSCEGSYVRLVAGYSQ